MKVKILALLAATMAVLLLTSSAQAEAFRVSGGGQTHKYATLGFTAASDRTGELTYHRDDGTFSLHCTRSPPSRNRRARMDSPRSSSRRASATG